MRLMCTFKPRLDHVTNSCEQTKGSKKKKKEDTCFIYIDLLLQKKSESRPAGSTGLSQMFSGNKYQNIQQDLLKIELIKKFGGSKRVLTCTAE